MDKPQSQGPGEEFGQLARQLFDSAADRWYLAFVIELATGLLAIIFSIAELPGHFQLALSFGGLILLGLAYVLRLSAEHHYDLAETMRRQSVLSIGLGWSISRRQATAWRVSVSKKLRKHVMDAPLDPTYYETSAGVGALKLAEMTLESAFWTRMLYSKILHWSLWLTVGAFVGIGVVALATLTLLPDSVQDFASKLLFNLIPVLLTANFLGWTLRLKRLVNSIQGIEASLDSMLEAGSTPQSDQVLREVSEYNSQVAAGIPIHRRMFEYWYDEIKELWSRYRRT